MRTSKKDQAAGAGAANIAIPTIEPAAAHARRVKLRRSIQSVIVAILPIILSGCATTTSSEPVKEKLDPDTATTVVVLNHPVELLSQSTHGSKSDPFAYIAPFETDRMGERTLYLWVSAPQDAGPVTQPQVLCNGQPLTLQPLEANSSVAGPAPSATTFAKPDTEALKVELSQLKLSHAPYDAPVPWSAQWYFRLPPEGLKCLAGANGVSLETRAASGDAQRFSTDRKNLATLDEFTRRY
ncbi:MAG TPA: hypothetical protein VFB37_13925 [Steroidobacteraceae bacterium]|nr:hypothetical protein [Steroidobacteraceae bacterium]